MKNDLNTLMDGLANYGVSVTQRPDGSVLLSVAHNGRQLNRVVDERYSNDELVRMIKFELIAQAEGTSLQEAAQYCCSGKLPTYSNTPITRTRSANLWESRKLKD